MSRRLVALTGDVLDELPSPCGSCLVWELGAPRPSRRSGERAVSSPSRAPGPTDGSPSDPAVRKLAWVSARVQDGTPPGRILRIDGHAVGYVLFAPARSFAPRRAPAPALSEDALALATIQVHPDHRGRGVGRVLVQAAIKEALRLEIRAVEAYGDRRWLERGCVLPATWLLHEGFEVHREHPRTPVFRVDVRRTLRWATSLEHALGEVRGALPRRTRVPVGDRAGAGGRPERVHTETEDEDGFTRLR